jgi:hypothetical protein
MDGAALALMSASYLDHILEVTLRLHFTPKLTADENRQMFNGAQGAILGTFSSKIRMSYVLGILPRAAYSDLLIINGIRNAFAHSLHKAIDFNNDYIKNDCDKLEYLKIYSPLGSPSKPDRTPLLTFIESVHAIYTSFRETADREIAFMSGFEEVPARARAPHHEPRASERAPSPRKHPRPSRRNQTT